ncbi:MAG: phosphoenolpyruvate--protein phosphotransferase [Acidobacteria bacterium]|nr:phosphoenolpyruvate--protein phosphotransferase [Acidobacteriota bacterium]
MKEFSEGKDSRQLMGVGLAPGVALGTAVNIGARSAVLYPLRINTEEVEAEILRLRKALRKSREQLEVIKEKFQKQLGNEHSFIIDAHLLMLEDKHLISEIENRIRQDLASSERALEEAGERWLSIYRSLDDPFFRERGSDLQEVVERVMENLSGLEKTRTRRLPSDLVLVAPEISLAMLADYDLDRVRGLVVTSCGRTSHVTIIARSYRIAVVSGIEHVETLIRTGDRVIVDGIKGAVYVNPSPEITRRCMEEAKEQKELALSIVQDRAPCATSEGRRVSLYINTEVGSEVQAGLRLGAEGVGLFRTEYVYMKNKKALVSEEEQFTVYRNLAENVRELPAMVRTLDIGDGRHPLFSHLAGEEDSVLGLRGMRFSLRHPEIFKSQIRAILRAGRHGNLQIILPMVSSADELIEGRRLIRQARNELESRGILTNPPQVGVMLEVPAAVWTLEGICCHADFLAVGTNDLIQYTLAVGRNNAGIAYLFNPLHPAILHTLSRIARAAQDFGKTAVVCGEVASSPVFAFLLVGMGFQHLSMNPYAIPEIKQMIRGMSYAKAREISEKICGLTTVAEVEQLVSEYFAGWPQLQSLMNVGSPSFSN